MAEAEPGELVHPGRGGFKRRSPPSPPSWPTPAWTAQANRRGARDLARMSLYHLTQLMRWPELLQPLTILKIYREACDRAGFLTGAQLAVAESARWKMAAEALAAPGLTDDQRGRMLAELQAREREVLGEDGAGPPSGFADVGTEE